MELEQAQKEREEKIAWWREADACVQLPPELQECLERNDPSFVSKVIQFAFLFLNGETEEKSGAWLWALYLNPHPLAQEGLLKILTTYRFKWNLVRQLPFLLREKAWKNIDQFYYGSSSYTLAFPNEQLFRYLKGIYKRSEEKREAAVWARLAYMWDHRFHYHERMALSPNTKRYLQRRAWRTLRRLGEQGSDDYVHMATELLLLYGTNDDHYIGIRDQNRRYEMVNVPLFYQQIIYQILYRHSPYLSFVGGKRTIDLEKMKKSANERVEAFPELWDRHPEKLFRLILESRVKIIVDFASRALRQGNPSFTAQLSLDDLLQPLQEMGYSQPGADFLVEEIFRRLDLERLDTDLTARLLYRSHYKLVAKIKGMDLSRLSFATLQDLYQKLVSLYNSHEQARYVWPQLFFEYLRRMGEDQFDITLIADALHSSNRSFVRTFLKQSSDWLTAEQKKYLIKDRVKIRNYSFWDLQYWLKFFKMHWANEFREVASFEWIHSLLRLSGGTVSGLGCIELIFNHIDFSTHPYTARELMALHQQIPYYYTDLRRKVEERLLEDPIRLGLDVSMMVDLLCRPLENGSGLDVIQKLYRTHREWLEPKLPQLIDQLWGKMVDPETDDSISQNILEWLDGYLWNEVMKQVPLDKVWALFRQERAYLLEFGVKIINERNLVHTLTLDDLHLLVHSRVARLRQIGRDWLIKVIDKAEEDRLVALTETDWDDTRHWMMGYLRSLSEEKVTPTLIYGLLDSSRADIQQFAMEMAEIYRKRMDPIQLMLRASESPHLAVQAFALELAEKIAWEPALLKQMTYFFRTIFFYVGKGRKLKRQALALLSRIGPTSLEMAQAVSEMLSDIAYTSGKKDFADILSLLTKCKRAYPELTTVVQIRG